MTDIAGERRKLAEQGLRIIRREAWGARQNYTSDRACEVPARALFLHISVTRLRADEHEGMREIEAIGQARFGIGCSYNAAAFPSGRLYEAQPLTRRGAHTVNNFERSTCPNHGGSLTAPSWNNNVNARALVLPQDVIDAVTDVQIDAAARWAAAQIRSGLVREGARWHGHRCVSAKLCPGDVGYARIRELQRLTDHYVATGLRPPTDLLEELMADPTERAALIEDIAAAVWVKMIREPFPLSPSSAAELGTQRASFGQLAGWAAASAKDSREAAGRVEADLADGVAVEQPPAGP
jgi:hypothetical protein